MKTKPLVSAIVPTYNSEGTIEKCLWSLKRQKHIEIEIIVVDTCSKDKTRELVEGLGVKVVETLARRSEARNIGARKSAGSFLLFVDSDMELDHSVVERCVQAIGLGWDAVVIPEISVGEGFWASCRALEKSCYVDDDLIEAARFIRRDVYERIEGYDPNLEAGEDWDMDLRIRKAGFKIGRIKAPIMHHEGHLRFQDVIIKRMYYGRFLKKYVRKHPEVAKKQLSPLRSAFSRNWRRLAGDPLHTLGLLLLKTTEAGITLLYMSLDGDSPGKRDLPRK